MIVRLILWAIGGFLLYTVIQAIWQALHAPRPTPGSATPGRDDGQMERDPQCGTFVLRNDALTATVGGEQYWFCSTRCRDKYTQSD